MEEKAFQNALCKMDAILLTHFQNANIFQAAFSNFMSWKENFVDCLHRHVMWYQNFMSSLEKNDG